MTLLLTRVSTGRRGAAVVEFALVISLISTAFLGLLEAGRAWFYSGLLTHAVHEGARLAAILPTLQADDPAVINRMQEVLRTGGIDIPFISGEPNELITLSVSFVQPLQAGRLVRVSGRVKFLTVVSGLLPNPWSKGISLRAQMITRYN